MEVLHNVDKQIMQCRTQFGQVSAPRPQEDSGKSHLGSDPQPCVKGHDKKGGKQGGTISTVSCSEPTDLKKDIL